MLQDKSSEFSTSSTVGIKNNIFANHVLGIYEVLIEAVFYNGNYRCSYFMIVNIKPQINLSN